MTNSERILRTILCVVGCTGALAYACVVFPYPWMNAIHQWAGLGELPDKPIVGYLARSLSFFYGMLSTILLLCSSDLRRFRPVIRLFGGLAVVLGALLLVIDSTGGMPRWWTIVEGIPTMVTGGAIWWLAGRVEDQRV